MFFLQYVACLGPFYQSDGEWSNLYTIPVTKPISRWHTLFLLLQATMFFLQYLACLLGNCILFQVPDRSCTEHTLFLLQATMFFLQYLACLCQIAACLLGSDELQELANCISWISDLVYCSVCACMQVSVFASERTRFSPPKVDISFPSSVASVSVASVVFGGLDMFWTLTSSWNLRLGLLLRPRLLQVRPSLLAFFPILNFILFLASLYLAFASLTIA
jgi:hypothetical protein